MRLVVLLGWSLPLLAQPLRVYSEFARIDPSGQVLAPAQPREILSPAIARNAFTSFQVVVDVSRQTHYWLHIGLNPEDAARVTLYRETGERLTPVTVPLEGDGSQILWMDVWVDRNAPVRRIKIEPQLYVDRDWVVYPMEARVVEAAVPDGARSEGALAPIAVMRGVVCGVHTEPAPAPDLSMARLRYRNAQQDAGLARNARPEDVRSLIGGCSSPAPADPEWYLRVRDYLFRLR